jgi:hypothetical protein
MTNSLSLNIGTWDIHLNSHGNLAIVNGKSRVAQDVACACRLFTDEAIFQVNRGVPYFKMALGQKPNQQLVNTHIRDIALSVPDVEDAQVVFYDFKDRTLSGEVLITDSIETFKVKI